MGLVIVSIACLKAKGLKCLKLVLPKTPKWILHWIGAISN